MTVAPETAAMLPTGRLVPCSASFAPAPCTTFSRCWRSSSPLGTGGAYAANTVRSTDIVDGEVTSADVANQNLTGGDIKDNSISTFDVASLVGDDIVDGTLTSADIKDFTLGNGDFLTGSVDSRVATDNSLTGTDINESTLTMPPTTTATFAGSGQVVLNFDESFTKVAAKTLPAGSYGITATANMYNGGFGVVDAVCELRNGSSHIGGAADRRALPSGDSILRTLSMNGGAQVPAGGGEVSLWCKTQRDDKVTDSQMMITRLDGFF